MPLNYAQAEVYFRDDFIPFSEANASIASSPVLYGLSIYRFLAPARMPPIKNYISSG